MEQSGIGQCLYVDKKQFLSRKVILPSAVTLSKEVAMRVKPDLVGNIIECNICQSTGLLLVSTNIFEETTKQKFYTLAEDLFN